MSKLLLLNNPFGGEPAQFSVIKTVSDESNEIIQTIKHLSEEYPELKEILKSYFQISKRFEKFYENLKLLCDLFNEWVNKNQENIQLKKLKVDSLKLRASGKLAKFILHLVYNRAVLEPEKLNHYEPFSPQVYGETSYDLIEEMLKRIKLEENDAFIDLGSGVGNVVLQVAAVSKCKICYGFEKAEWPARYAIKMEQEFKYWMNFFGKTYSEFRLYKGDFLSNEEFLEVASTSDSSMMRKISTGDYVKELIDQSKLIFVNNFAFGAAVDHQLKLRFQDMPEGAFIVSSKPFCSLNFRINDRNTNDLGAILNLNEFEPLNGHVSWTDRPINYYFQKIDRTLLEKYFESKTKQNLKIKDENDNCERLSRSRNRNSNSPHSHRSMNSSLSSSHTSSSSTSSDSSEDSNSLNRLKKSKRSISNENRKRKSSSVVSESEKKPRSSLKKKRKVVKEHKKERKRSKSLDKKEKKTLEKMHIQVTKMIKSSKEDKKINSKSAFSAQKDSNDALLKNDYNNKAMTKLSSDNLDTKLLKDTKISNKFNKHLDKNGFDKVCNGERLNGIKDSHSIRQSEVSDEIARRELGEDIINSIDDYFKICRQQYIKYLLYMKSNEYKEKINLEYQKELILKAELMNKKEELETKKKAMIKNNIVLLKQRASELGIKDLQSPNDLIQYAKDILSQHRVLEQKINSILDTVSNKNNQNPIIKSDEKKLLDQFVSKHDSFLQTNETTLTRTEDDSKSAHQNPGDIKSVSSISADETMTATERADEDEEILSNGREKETSQKENESQNGCKKSLSKPLRPHSNPSASSKSIMDKIFQNDKTDSLKSFKIPKQSRKEHNNLEYYDKDYSTSLTNSIPNAGSFYETTTSRSGKHNRNLSGDLEFSSSPSYQPESKSYPNYYHPKKKYMMENSNSKHIDNFNGYRNKNENGDFYRTGSTFSTQSSSGSSQPQNELNTQY
uniref:Histone-lysine N-methyltransferase, H3 lysine-79 specific n=1 Tax=Brachionus koreanus TaxID=1199090 RepID=A0A4Y6ETR7_9BILA|nr:histone-lysine N-methyltransferase, H3 lysine-79 specific-like protein [Brachionus koreanus]